MHDIIRREGPAASLPLISETILPGLSLLKRGRNKDLYDLGETLLVVHTDRGGDSSMPLEAVIPGRGQLGNQLSAYWFQRLREVFPTTSSLPMWRISRRHASPTPRNWLGGPCRSWPMQVCCPDCVAVRIGEGFSRIDPAGLRRLRRIIVQFFLSDRSLLP
jgi:hypothetical protein